MKINTRKILIHEWRGMIGLAGILVLISGFYYHKTLFTEPSPSSDWIQKIDSLTTLWASDTLPDLNRAGAGDMIRAGVPVRFAFRIERARNKLGAFRSWEQLREVYGMTDSIYHIVRRETFLDTSNLPEIGITRASEDQIMPKPRPSEKLNASIPDLRNTGTIDINAADSLALVALNGIGPVLSKRILSFREKLGGFCQIDQVKETYGLPPETFDRIKHKITVISPCHKVNPNHDSIEEMSRHLYIPDWMAEKIVRIRERDSFYVDATNFKLRTGYKEPYFSRLQPYLTFD